MCKARCSRRYVGSRLFNPHTTPLGAVHPWLSCALLFAAFVCSCTWAGDNSLSNNYKERWKARVEMADLDLYHNCAVLTDRLAGGGSVPETAAAVVPMDEWLKSISTTASQLQVVTLDPWGNPYLIWIGRGGFVLISTGRDGTSDLPYASLLKPSPETVERLRKTLQCKQSGYGGDGDDIVYTQAARCR